METDAILYIIKRRIEYLQDQEKIQLEVLQDLSIGVSRSMAWDYIREVSTRRAEMEWLLREKNRVEGNKEKSVPVLGGLMVENGDYFEPSDAKFDLPSMRTFDYLVDVIANTLDTHNSRHKTRYTMVDALTYINRKINAYPTKYKKS
jgi:hypothetical protein